MNHQNYFADFLGDDLIFKNYTNLTLSEATKVLSCRNDESVRKWMLTDEIISLKDHLTYIQNLKTVKNRSYWAVFKDSVFLGGVSIVDFKNTSACTGIFLNPILIGTGVGLKINFYFTEHLYKDLKFESTFGEVHKNNKNAIKLNKYFGAVLTEKEGDFFETFHNAKIWEQNRLKVMRLITYA